ncbi:hypothetical protein HMP0721_0083 [Pseudoramibacter alactolyticus ATCC 23263]|uniref:Uncharacterized protein n=1 Tax=Pseudoramibacter alactolyticus ATCC 23263 TaxID=887929 RepID=E6MDK1_9FIRM|nr:hypothetical protein HMP0721_0083 [Pseudoramibacter alactolyticus ATCC 23263]
MFDCLLKQYKKDVLNTKAKFNIGKVLKLNKKVRFILMAIMIAVGMVLFVEHQGDKYLSLFALVFVGICSFLLFNQMKSEEPIIFRRD